MTDIHDLQVELLKCIPGPDHAKLWWVEGMLITTFVHRGVVLLNSSWGWRHKRKNPSRWGWVCWFDSAVFHEQAAIEAHKAMRRSKPDGQKKNPAQ